MAYLEKIEALNNYKEEGKIPFLVDNIRYGQIKQEYLDLCKESVFNYSNGSLVFKDKYKDFNSRSLALEEFAIYLEKENIINIRGEKYGLVTKFGDKPKALYDRALSTFLGTLSFGQHLNGVIKKDNELFMWIGVRAKDKGYSGGMLDSFSGWWIAFWYKIRREFSKRVL